MSFCGHGVYIYLYDNIGLKKCPLFSETAFLCKIVPENSLCIVTVIKAEYIALIAICFVCVVISTETFFFVWPKLVGFD